MLKGGFRIDSNLFIQRYEFESQGLEIGLDTAKLGLGCQLVIRLSGRNIASRIRSFGCMEGQFKLVGFGYSC